MLWNNRVSAALELTAVQSGKLGLELLVFQFELADAAVFFLKLLIERLNDVFAMATMKSLGYFDVELLLAGRDKTMLFTNAHSLNKHIASR